MVVMILTSLRTILATKFGGKTDFFFVKSGSDAIKALMKVESDITAFLIVAVKDGQFEDLYNPKSERNQRIAAATSKLHRLRSGTHAQIDGTFNL